MGGRLSKPRAADGFNELAAPSSRVPRTINGRTLVAPLAAATMACLLFFYSRTSIHAARLNAQKHREADGGQLNWRNESLRRHGQLDKIDDRSLLKEALIGNKEGSSETMDAKVEEMRRKAPGDADSTKMLEQIKSRGKRSRKEGD